MIDEKKLAELRKYYPPDTYLSPNVEWSDVYKWIEDLQRVARAAENFLAQIPCYSTGISTLREEDMRPLHDELVRALSALNEKAGK